MTSKSNGLDAGDWARAPPSGPFWQRFLLSIYNPKEKSFLGRTPKRWGIVFTFYLVFYAVLALMFALCMGGLLLSLDTSRPTYTLSSSLIGENPGVCFRPHSEDHLVRYGFNASSIKDYVHQLDEFLKPYSGESWMLLSQGCSPRDSYGFPTAPCFFIKLNRIFDWKPEYYDDVNALPKDMPEDLVEHINSLDSPEKRKKVWISCFEEHGNSTRVEYPWGRGLPDSFYPFNNEEGYKSPLVAVRLLPPANTLVTIRCRAWAKNIIHNPSLKEASGYARIQLYIDDASNPVKEAAK